jgi:hypothetical protein
MSSKPISVSDDEHAIMALMRLDAWQRRPLSTIRGIYLGFEFEVTPDRWASLKTNPVAIVGAQAALRVLRGQEDPES